MFKSLEQLRADARNHGIKGYSRMNKTQLCVALDYDCRVVARAKPKRRSPANHIQRHSPIKPKQRSPVKQSPIKHNKKVVYHTLDNGGEPFEVVIEGKHVIVYKGEYGSDGENPDVYNKKVYEVYCQKVFIGYSPEGELADGYGPEFDGNSILLNTIGKEYVFIGESIFSFEALYPIIKYVSPVGNSGVPYPFAIDTQDNYYLMIEDVIVNMKNKKMYQNDPYHYYYQNNMLTSDLSGARGNKVAHFEDIYHAWSGNEQITLTYHPIESKTEGYEWLTRMNVERNTPYMLLGKSKNYDTKPSKLYVADKLGHRRELSKNEYLNVMKRFAQAKGFTPLHKTVIEKRGQ